MKRCHTPSGIRLLAMSAIMFISTAGCRVEIPKEQDASHRQQIQWSDHDALFMIERLPMGLSAAEVQQIIPSADTPQSGEGPLSHLSTSAVDGQVLGHSGRLELNFDNGILYSYYFRIEPGCAEAERLTDTLRTRYSARYGEGVHEAEQEPGYAMDSSFWDAAEADLALTLGRQGDQCRLAWGFQQAQS